LQNGGDACPQIGTIRNFPMKHLVRNVSRGNVDTLLSSSIRDLLFQLAGQLRILVENSTDLICGEAGTRLRAAISA